MAALLTDALEVLGERRAFWARELTKSYEELQGGELSNTWSCRRICSVGLSGRPCATAPIILDEIAGAADLPAGWGAEASPGRYRLVQRDRRAPVRPRGGPDVAGSAGRSRRGCPMRVGTADAAGVHFAAVEPVTDPARVPGRARLRDRRAADPGARAPRRPGRRRRLSGAPRVRAHRRGRMRHAHSTCFCTSMGTGPEVTGGSDVALTELDDGFVVRVGSPPAPAVIDSLDLALADPSAGRRAPSASRRRRPRGDGRRRSTCPTVPTRAAGVARPPALGRRRRALPGLHQLHARLPDLLLHQRRRSGRTSTAPTSTSERTWDSCFTDGFARVAGGSFRPQVKDRYRQWLTHKFSTWWDQFGSSGCVGCGRCIAWCPVGIDVREELAAIAGAGPSRARRRMRRPHAAGRRRSRPRAAPRRHALRHPASS